MSRASKDSTESGAHSFDFDGWSVQLPASFGEPKTCLHQYDLQPTKGTIMLREVPLDKQEKAALDAQAEEVWHADLACAAILGRLDVSIGPGREGRVECIKEDIDQRDGMTVARLHAKQISEGRDLHWHTAAATRGAASFTLTAVGPEDLSSWVDPVAENVEIYPIDDDAFFDRPWRLQQPEPTEHAQTPPQAAIESLTPVPQPPKLPQNMADPAIKDEPGLGGCDGSPILRREVTKGLRLLRYHKDQFPLTPYLTAAAFDSLWSDIQSRMALKFSSDHSLLYPWGYAADVPSQWRTTSATSCTDRESGAAVVFSNLRLPGPVFHHAICGWVVLLERLGFALQNDHCLTDDQGSYYLARFKNENPYSLAMRMVGSDAISILAHGPISDDELIGVLRGIREIDREPRFPTLELGLFNYDLPQHWDVPGQGQAHELEACCTLSGGILPEPIPGPLRKISDAYDRSMSALNQQPGMQVELLSREHGKDPDYEMERLLHRLTIEEDTVLKKVVFMIKPRTGPRRNQSKLFHLDFAIPQGDREPEFNALFEALVAKAVEGRKQLDA